MWGHCLSANDKFPRPPPPPGRYLHPPPPLLPPPPTCWTSPASCGTMLHPIPMPVDSLFSPSFLAFPCPGLPWPVVSLRRDLRKGANRRNHFSARHVHAPMASRNWTGAVTWLPSLHRLPRLAMAMAWWWVPAVVGIVRYDGSLRSPSRKQITRNMQLHGIANSQMKPLTPLCSNSVYDAKNLVFRCCLEVPFSPTAIGPVVNWVTNVLQAGFHAWVNTWGHPITVCLPIRHLLN